jgi:hypothetical protein
MPCSNISLLRTFRTPENYRMESILFDVTEVNLPFNTILGRPALYQFIAIAHYGYLVMKMSSPSSIIKIYGDRTTGIFVLEKLQALVATHEGAAGPGDQDSAPSSSCQSNSTSAPHVQPKDNEGIPVMTIQIGKGAAQTTRIAGDLGDK